MSVQSDRRRARLHAVDCAVSLEAETAGSTIVGEPGVE
jgi:hypothetical protein